MKKQFGDYYVGLDIGTDSLGWAVTDAAYNIQKLNGKALWGIRLFEAGKTAEERRIFRAARRRQQRKVQRIKLLQELFDKEINTIDPLFFLRMEESKFFIDDKQNFQPFALFSDDTYNDKNYFKEFPTIYHLRKTLIDNKQTFDVRLVYLAIHHILKHRGHFLFEGRNLENIEDFSIVFNELCDCLCDEFNIDWHISNTTEIETILLDTKQGIKNREKQLVQVLGAQTKQEKCICGLLAGGTKSLSDLFEDDTLDEAEIKKICFSDAKYEDQKNILEDILEERFFIVEKMKAICDWSVLADIRKGERYLSFSKVAVYEKHKQQLALLKSLVKKYLPHKYKELFTLTEKGKANYPAYIAMTKSNQQGAEKKASKKTVLLHTCNQEEFCKFTESLISNLSVEEEDTADFEYIVTELSNRTLLPKQVIRDNGVIPYQIHQEELITILNNAEKYLPFLAQKDESGFTVSEKILKIFTFRIPYYVGPLNDAHKEQGGNCWIVKHSDEKIRPWNFENVVDVEASAENFIYRMTNKCTYLPTANVLPKSSLLYSEFMVLNELNNLKINNETISNEIKNKIFNDLFLVHKKVTNKRLRTYLEIENIIGKKDELSGIDGDFKASLTSYIDFKNIIGEKCKNIDLIEELIRWIVLFGEDKKLLRSKIGKNFGNVLSAEEIKKICTLKYTGWGRLSKEFLTEIYHVDKATGEVISIISNLRNTTNNLMQLLSNQFDYIQAMKEYNDGFLEESSQISYDSVEKLYVSPAVKRGIWQTLQIIEEIIKITGHNPKKIFVEMARSEEEKNVRKESRKNRLIELYKACKEEQRDWLSELEDKSESDLRRDRLYLYYTQMGRCMYTGEPISLQELFNANLYDVDHIFPQSKIKDDSLENRVLVKRTLNSEKSNEYPLPKDMQAKCGSFWKALYLKGFIGKKKLERLVRTTPFSDDELANFIARQLVETRQSTKAVAEILSNICSDSEVVYVKAGNVSRFRQDFSILKVRDVNDYHHAKDAYLNIVVGNVYNTKFTHSPINFIKKYDGQKYNLNRMYDFDVERSGDTAWKAGSDGTIATVKKTVSKNNILFTRYAREIKGGLFDQMLVKAGSGQAPIKGSDERFCAEKGFERYGGYNKASGAYFMLVEHTIKSKRVRTIEFVPVYLAAKLRDSDESKMEYCGVTLRLEEPRVLIDKIKIDSLFCVDGFYMHLSGRTSNQLIFKNANQLVVSGEMEAYIKKLSNFNLRVKEAKKELAVHEFDKISAEENIALYDLFLEKLGYTVYNKRLGTQFKNLKDMRDKFIELTVEKQVKVLMEMLNLFKCTSVTADLSLLGGAKNAGTIKISNNITSTDTIYLLHQSVTGIFNQSLNLLQL